MAERELTLREKLERLTWLKFTTGHPYYLDPDVSMKAYNAVRREVGPVQHVFPGYHLTAPSPSCPKPLLHANRRHLGSAELLLKSNSEIIQVLTSSSDQDALEEFPQVVTRMHWRSLVTLWTESTNIHIAVL